MQPFLTFSRANWKKRRSIQNKQRHAAQVRRAPGWNPAIPPNSLSIRAAADSLAVTQKALFAWLSEAGWILRHPDSDAWTAHEVATQHGWLVTRRKTIGHQRYVFQALVTPDGLSELATHTAEFSYA